MTNALTRTALLLLTISAIISPAEAGLSLLVDPLPDIGGDELLLKIAEGRCTSRYEDGAVVSRTAFFCHSDEVREFEYESDADADCAAPTTGYKRGSEGYTYEQLQTTVTCTAETIAESWAVDTQHSPDCGGVQSAKLPLLLDVCQKVTAATSFQLSWQAEAEQLTVQHFASSTCSWQPLSTKTFDFSNGLEAACDGVTRYSRPSAQALDEPSSSYLLENQAKKAMLAGGIFLLCCLLCCCAAVGGIVLCIIRCCQQQGPPPMPHEVEMQSRGVVQGGDGSYGQYAPVQQQQQQETPMQQMPVITGTVITGI